MAAALTVHNPRFRLLSPVPAGELVHGFDPRGDSCLTYAAPAGAGVVAAAAGTVAYAGPDPAGASTWIAIAHAGRVEFDRLPALTTFYDGLGTVTVRRGEHVDVGQVIGRMPAADGFLKFSLSRGHERLDPRPHLR
jgi:murein DD-endopeptidase MepM/ murein hydrolase activator NlpD